MATSTAPTEAEIREAIAVSAARVLPLDRPEIGEWVSAMTDPLTYYAPEEDVDPSAPRGLWDNLRPTEAEDLRALVEGIYHQADAIEQEVKARIAELVVAAALEFARRHPDAPRRAREAVTA